MTRWLLGGQEPKRAGLPWLVCQLVEARLRADAGGKSSTHVKNWHMTCRNTRDAARAHAHCAVVGAHSERDDLSTTLQLCAPLKRLRVVVRWGARVQLDPGPPGTDLSRKLAEIPEKVLVVEPASLNASAAAAFLRQCKALHAVVNFTCVFVEKRGPWGGAAVRGLCAALEGNLKLVCSADACASMWLPNHVDCCSQLAHVRELRLLPSVNNVAALQAVAMLPGLRKLVLQATSEEEWCAVCKITQLEELRVTSSPGKHLAELLKLRNLARLRMRVYPLWGAVEPGLLREVLDGLPISMPLLTSLDLRVGNAEIKRGDDPSLWRLATP